jgi:hypothetical protein
VLNDHTQHANKYCGTRPECVAQFNRLLLALPGTKVVISSAWRYLLLGNHQTLFGFEAMLMTHGVSFPNAIHSHTRIDKHRDEPRIEQIRDWLLHYDPQCEGWIALDDMHLADDPRCFRIRGDVGLTSADVDSILASV